MAGLVPAIHAAPPRSPNPLSARPCKAHEVKALGFALTRGRDAPERVDGRDKPGHDALRPAREALPYSDFLALPTANAISAYLLLDNELRDESHNMRGWGFNVPLRAAHRCRWPTRLLYRELEPGASDGANGEVGLES